MTMFDVWVQGSSAKAVGWTLVHSLWEGAVVALALAIVLGIARSSRARYWAACFAMIALFAGFGATFYRMMPREIGIAPKVPIPAAAVALSPDDAPIGITGTRWEFSDVLPWLAPVWMAGVLLFQLRCLASWVAAGRLRRRGVCGASVAWIARLDGLRARLRMTRPVMLLESCFLEVPVVIGHLRPVILMPVGLLAGLPVAQIESILLHELAHIRRADYLVNLMQTLVEGLLFYHPAVWWISGVMRTERENCCDDLAVSTSGDAHEYATALAALAENRCNAAIAATGGNIVKRIRRVLAQPEGPRAAMAPALSAGVLIVTCAVALAAWQTPQQSDPAIVPVIPVAQAPAIEAAAHAQSAPVVAPQAVAQKRQEEALERLREAVQKLEAAQRHSMMLAQNERGPLADPALTPYRKWLNEEVVYIITAQERAAFLKLTSDDERNMFIRQFWARRDPMYPKTGSPEEYPIIPKGNPENDFKKEHYRRIKYADDRFATKIPGWKTDRGRIYIIYGPPDEIESHPSGGKYTRPAEEGGGTVDTFPFEQWMYRYIEGIGKNVIMEFVDTTRTGDYRMTMDPKEKAVRPVPEQQDVVFSSAGPGEKAVVVVRADRNLRVTLPIDYDATRFSTVVTSLQGKTIWSTGAPLTDPCEGKAEDSGCRSNYLHTVTQPPLPTGSYVMTAVVTDSSTWTDKTYVVNFSVH